MSAKTLPPLYIPASREPVHSQPSWSNDGRTSSGNLAPSGTQTRATGHAEIRTTTTSAPDVDLTKVTYELGAAFRYFWQAAVDILEIVTSAPVMAADGLDKGVKGLPLPGHEGAAAWGSGPQRVGPQPSSRGWDPQPSSRGRSVVAPMYRSGTGRVRLATMATAGAPTGGGLPKPPSGRRTPQQRPLRRRQWRECRLSRVKNSRAALWGYRGLATPPLPGAHRQRVPPLPGAHLPPVSRGEAARHLAEHRVLTSIWGQTQGVGARGVPKPNSAFGNLRARRAEIVGLNLPGARTCRPWG